MEISTQISELDFLDIAQRVAPVDGADVYFYAMSNEDINVRKTVVNDFETWIVIYNHFDGTTVIITGAAPLVNTERYTLVQKLENVIKLEPVVIEPVTEPEVPTEE
jgi:hypothetical protein